MLQTGRRPQPEIFPACRPDDPRKGSKWKPAFQRIKQGIFSGKGAARLDISSPSPPVPLNEIDEQCLNQRTQSQAVGKDGRNPLSKYFRKESQTTPQPECPTEPPELNDTKGHNFFRRRLTRSKRKDHAATNEFAQLPQHKRRHADLTKPPAAAHGPKQGRPWEEESLLQRPATTAYIPQHAASDFKRMSIGGPQLERYTSQDEQASMTPLNPGHPVTVRPVAFQPDDESGDFQNFLAQSRAEAVRTYESSGLRSPNKILPIETEKIMTEIEANYRAAVGDRPTTSASKRVSRSGSVFEQVGEYIKPSELAGVKRDTVANHRLVERALVPFTVTRHTSTKRPVSRSENFFIGIGEYIKPSNPDHLQEGGNNPRTGYLTVGDAQDRQAKRWSRISDTSRRSVSQEREWEGDRRAARASWTSNGTFGRKRSSTMPTSPGLDRYNRGVRKGMY
jgi:hypothetical protein